MIGLQPQRAGANANLLLSANLRELADLLEQQEADDFRVKAWRRAADTLDALERPVADIFAHGGREALAALPGIGRSIASAIAEMLATGRSSQLERLRGTIRPEALFRTISGIGPELAARLHDALHIDTLQALELAAYDGRLAGVEGFGSRRLQMVRAALAERLGRPRVPRMPQGEKRPSVRMLLDVDREYREKAAAGLLRTIAPKRFNPEGSAWLPILHTRRGPWHFTALFSNTRLAHALGRTGDWVVIFHHSASTTEAQSTVVTETRGPLAGQRVVRGREQETTRPRASVKYLARRSGRGGHIIGRHGAPRMTC